MAVKHLIRWVITRSPKKQTADVAKLFWRTEIVGQFGSSSVVWTDQGPAFLLTAWTKTLKAAGTVPKTTDTYSPQSNGRAERMIQTIKDAIGRSIASTHAKWDELLLSIVDSIRAERAKDGHSPYELMFGVPADRCLSLAITMNHWG